MSVFPLQSLPHRTSGAALNMAIDLHMLNLCHRTGRIYFRSYDWDQPSVTFGYGQRWSDIAQLPGMDACNPVRRPTGGGVVHHGGDYTYACAIPITHPFHRQKIALTYNAIHAALVNALSEAGISATLAPCHNTCGTKPAILPAAGPGGPAQCFTQPEPSDVIDPQTGRKIAGAALKRNQQGLLIQGSISLKLPHSFSPRLARQLALCLEANAADTTDLFIGPDITTQTEQFSSAQWNQRR